MRNRLVLVASLLLMAVAFVGCPQPPKPPPKVPVVIAVDTLPVMTVAVKWQYGPYSGVDALMTELMAWVNAQQFDLPPETKPFAVYYDGPAVPGEDKTGWFCVCHMVPPGTVPADAPGISIEQWSAKQLVVVKDALVPAGEVWTTVKDVLSKWPAGVGEAGPPYQKFAQEMVQFRVGLLVGPLPFPPPDTLKMNSTIKKTIIKIDKPIEPLPGKR